MRNRTAALICATFSLLAIAQPALATPANVSVRIEGRTGTIFDRVVHTDGHAVQSSSDTMPRTCDGTNGGVNPSAGPTATAAAVDALGTQAQDFDGAWNSGFDDYLISRIGPESQDTIASWYWGNYENRIYSLVGGCQQRVANGDEVLWALNGWPASPLLKLGGPAETTVGTPTTFSVQESDGNTTALTNHAGATVSGVTDNGAPLAMPTGVTPGTSNASGNATVTFSNPGWRRVKARHPGIGAGADAVAIASNSVDVCVKSDTVTSCEGLPPSQRPLLLPVDPPTTPPEEPHGDGGTGGQNTPKPTAQITKLASSTASRSTGKVRVSWSQVAGTEQVKQWELTARSLTKAGASAVVQAKGQGESSADLKLPGGDSFELKLNVTDAKGAHASASLGSVSVPVEENAAKFNGSWKRRNDASAWSGKVRVGKSGATAKLPKLGTGHIVLFARSATAKSAKVEIRSGGKRERISVATSGSGELKTKRAYRKGQALTLKVLSGSVAFDGVAVAP